MDIHANVRTSPNSRRLLVKRIEEENWSLMEAAGISERSARKWLGRWRSEGSRDCWIAAPLPNECRLGFPPTA